MPNAINISLAAYNSNLENASPSLKKILTRNKFRVIVIDDPGIFQRKESLIKAWNEQRKHYIEYFYFGDVRSSDELFLTDEDLTQISGIINLCLNNNEDLIVSCVAGLSRSGAVVKAACFAGMTNAEAVSTPNTDIYLAILDKLGLRMTSENSAFN